MSSVTASVRCLTKHRPLLVPQLRLAAISLDATATRTFSTRPTIPATVLPSASSAARPQARFSHHPTSDRSNAVDPTISCYSTCRRSTKIKISEKSSPFSHRLFHTSSVHPRIPQLNKMASKEFRLLCLENPLLGKIYNASISQNEGQPRNCPSSPTPNLPLLP